jgi:hypothetical protein
MVAVHEGDLANQGCGRLDSLILGGANLNVFWAWYMYSNPANLGRASVPLVPAGSQMMSCLLQDARWQEDHMHHVDCVWMTFLSFQFMTGDSKWIKGRFDV